MLFKKWYSFLCPTQYQPDLRVTSDVARSVALPTRRSGAGGQEQGRRPGERVEGAGHCRVMLMRDGVASRPVGSPQLLSGPKVESAKRFLNSSWAIVYYFFPDSDVFILISHCSLGSARGGAAAFSGVGFVDVPFLSVGGRCRACTVPSTMLPRAPHGRPFA